MESINSKEELDQYWEEVNKPENIWPNLLERIEDLEDEIFMDRLQKRIEILEEKNGLAVKVFNADIEVYDYAGIDIYNLVKELEIIKQKHSDLVQFVLNLNDQLLFIKESINNENK